MSNKEMLIVKGVTYIRKMAITNRESLSETKFTVNLVLVSPVQFDKYNPKVMLLVLNKGQTM